MKRSSGNNGPLERIENEKRGLRIAAECLHRSAYNRRSVRRTLKRASSCEHHCRHFPLTADVALAFGCILGEHDLGSWNHPTARVNHRAANRSCGALAQQGPAGKQETCHKIGSET